MKSTLQLNIRQIQCWICVWSRIICGKAKPYADFSFAGFDCPALHTVHECCFMHKTSSACQEISSGVDEEGSLFSPASLFSLSISNFQATPHSERQAQQGSTEHNFPPCCNSCFWSAMYHYWELHVVICVLWPDVFWGGRWRRGWSQMKSSRAQVQTHSHLGLLPAEHGRHRGLM